MSQKPTGTAVHEDVPPLRGGPEGIPRRPTGTAVHQVACIHKKKYPAHYQQVTAVFLVQAALCVHHQYIYTTPIYISKVGRLYGSI